MAIDFCEKSRQIEEAIRRGKASHARTELRQLKKIKIPREHAATISSLAYRAGMPSFGLRVLNGVVRPHRRSPVAASDEEKAVYAQCLNRIGASEEALGILDGLDPSKVPQVYFFKATALISRWDYEATIPLWTKYIRASGTSNYQKMVGKLNLSAALVYTRDHKRATPLLRELLYDTSLRRLDLLYGNALELSAQNYVAQEKWTDAEKCLSLAEKKLTQTDTIDMLFVHKWKTLIHVKRSGGARDALEELAKLREESLNRQHWETLRQCDDFAAMATADREMFLKVYFGTPFESYRARLLEEFPQAVALPEKYLWRPIGDNPKLILDVKTGETTKKNVSLREGHVMHRLLAVLTSDFYRPLRTAAIHFRLNPNEFFNPFSSPPRVHEAVKRLRLWFEDSSLPFQVDEHAGFYQLKFAGPCGIAVTQTATPIGKHSSPIEKLRAEFANNSFSLREAAERLDVPDRTLHRILDQALKEGRLQRIGQSRATRYTFASNSKAA